MKVKLLILSSFIFFHNVFYAVSILKSFNSLPNDKILDLTKLKAFADNKLYDTKMMISLFDRVEKTEGKGKNAGYQHFLLSPKCFPKPFFRVVKKSGLCGKELSHVSASLNLGRSRNGVLGNRLTLHQTIPCFHNSGKEGFCNIVGKGGNAGNWQFYLPQR